MLAVADNQHAPPSRSPTTNSIPAAPGSIATEEIEPSSFFRAQAPIALPPFAERRREARLRS
jgi:hypothetical protein